MSVRPFQNSRCGPLCRQTLLKSLMYVEYTALFRQFPCQAQGQCFPNTDLTERVMKQSQS